MAIPEAALCYWTETLQCETLQLSQSTRILALNKRTDWWAHGTQIS